MSEPYHTPHSMLVLKGWSWMLPLIIPFMLCFANDWVGYIYCLVGGYIGVWMLMYGIATIMRIFFFFYMLNDEAAPAYNDFRARGGCPFFDWHLGWNGFNRHPIETYTWYCDRCGTLNPGPYGYCRNCGGPL